MLLRIDGSQHRWFQDERWYDLIVILDDATNEIYYAQLVEEESTLTVMAGLQEVIERKGLFCTLYSDRGSHFGLTPKAGAKVDSQRLTQVGRTLRDLGIQMIPAYSPQARGRSASRSLMRTLTKEKREALRRLQLISVILRRDPPKVLHREPQTASSGLRTPVGARWSTWVSIITFSRRSGPAANASRSRSRLRGRAALFEETDSM
jgi:hypothetical protein